MRAIQLTIIVIVWLCGSAYGGKVDMKRAEVVAMNYYLSRTSLENRPDLKSHSIQAVKMQLVHRELAAPHGVSGLKSGSSLPLYYVFNAGTNNGFIIVSADDRIYPVLGYSFHGRFSIDNQPPAFRDWMKHYKTQILEVISNDLEPSAASPIPGEWARYSGGIVPDADLSINAAGPLLSTRWGQGCYYNKFCPEDDRGPCDQVWAGCVAVAMGQIMKYWNEPYASNATAGYEDPINYDADGLEVPGSDYGPIPGFVSTVYDWAGMPDTLTAESSVAEVDAIAELLLHCGIAAEMNYGPYGSRAKRSDARNAFVSSFNYAPSAQIIDSEYFTITEWQNILINELDLGRPIYFRGNDGESGHAFVCDGYRGSREFHFNWGFRGSFQGNYFYLDELTPGDYNFSQNQAAIIGIYPDHMTQDPCDNMIAIDGTGAEHMQTYAGGGAGVWNVDGCGDETPGSEQVYSFVAPESGNYNIIVTAASGYVEYFWQASDCARSGWNCIGDIYDAGHYGSINWTAGTTYYILLDDENAAAGTHQFYLQSGLQGVMYNRHEIDDDQSISSGDDDGKAEPGESIELTVTLFNSGSEAVHNVTAILSTPDPDITITDDTVNYGTIDGGANDRVPDFDFDVSLACPEKDIMFALDITADEGSWTDVFYVHIYGTIEENPCENILAINGCGPAHTQTFTSGGDGAWDIAGCGYNTPGKEQVYSFVAPATGEYSLTVTSASGYVDYYWQASGCGDSGWTCIQDIDIAGSIGSMTWTADATYYILLDDEDTLTGTHQFHINCGSPMLAYDSHEIDDDQSTSWGDNDGKAEPGESIELAVTLLNSGSGAAHSVTAVLATVDPHITITDDTLNFGIIAGGTTNRNTDFDFDVSPDCPGKDVMFTLDITADEGSWSDSFTVHIYDTIMDPCDSAITISGCGEDHTQTFAGAGIGIWDISNCGFPTPGMEQVYRFVAPGTGDYAIDVTSATGTVDYLWQASFCRDSGWECIGSISNPWQYGSMSWTRGKTYYILLDSETSTGGSHEFNIHWFAVGVKEKQLSVIDLYVYPNPAQDLLNISTQKDLMGKFSVSIINVMGSSLYAGSLNNLMADEDHQLDISFLERGIYFIRIQHEKINKTLRFIKY